VFESVSPEKQNLLEIYIYKDVGGRERGTEGERGDGALN
jgi:hypothetical protein